MHLNCSLRRLVSIFGFIICLAFSTGVLAKTHYVDKWGGNTSSCTKTQPCLTIQHAINQARRNDRIIVGPGVYTENLTIDTNGNGPLEGLKLESVAGFYATIITAAVTSDPVITISQPKVQIGKKRKGFSVEGATSHVGIFISTAAASRCKIEGNRAMGNGWGFDLRGEKIRVRYNVAKDNASDGIRCTTCYQALIRENRVVDNGANGILLEASDKAIVQRNVASGNDGISFRISSTSDFAKIQDNVAELGSDSGIRISDADGAVIQGNIAVRNGNGAGLAPDIGVEVSQFEFNKSPVIKNNLAISTNYDQGFHLYGLLSAKVEGNTSVQNGSEGITIQGGALIATLKNNNTIDNDNGGASCGLHNDSGSAITYTRHFFGGGDGQCGTSPLAGTFATKPSPLKVRIASGL